MAAEVRFSAPLSLLAPASNTLPSNFSGIAYTGGLVPSYGAVVDLASTTVPRSMSLLYEHQRDQIVGKVDSASVRDGQIVVAGKLYSDMAGTPAEGIAQRAARGTDYEMSIGLFNFSEEFVPAGGSAHVNGRSFAGPMTVMRNGTVRECSICVLGADANTSVSMFSQQSTSRAAQIQRLLSEAGEVIPMEQCAQLYVMSDAEFRAFAERARGVAARETAALLSLRDVYGRRAAALSGKRIKSPNQHLPGVDPASIYARRRAKA